METTAETLVETEPEQHPNTLISRTLINRNFALLFSGQLISRTGDTVFAMTLIIWTATVLARNQPWSFIALSGLFFLPPLAVLLVGPFAGVFVDRWDKRRTMLIMDGIRGVLITVLLITTIVPLPYPPGSDAANILQLIITYVVILLASFCTPFFNPSLFTLIRDVVPEPELPRAFGLAELQANIAVLVGPTLAATFFIALGVRWLFLLNAISFFISFCAILFIRPPAIAPKAQTAQPEELSVRKSFVANFMDEFRDGLRYFLSNQVLITLMGALLITTFATAGVAVLNIFFVTDNLHMQPFFFPFAEVAFGVGAIAGAAYIAPRLMKHVATTTAFWGANIASGLLIFVLSRLTYFPAALLILCLFGIAQSIFNIAFGPILLKVTPREMMGRVNSLLSPPLTLVATLSIALVDFLATTTLHGKHTHIIGIPFGSVDVLYTVAGLLVLAGGIFAMFNLREASAKASVEGESAGTVVAPAQPRFVLSKQSIRYIQFAVFAVAIISSAFGLYTVASAKPAVQAKATMKQAPNTHPANGAAVDGISCNLMEGTAEHIHVYVEMFANGQQVSMPGGIGIVAPKSTGVVSITTNGKLTCLYSLHVHANDNIIHIEAPEPRTFTFGQFSDIWGQPLSKTQFAGYTGSLTYEIFDENGVLHPVSGDPRAIKFSGHDTIVILYNSPHVHPVAFTDWNGE